MAKNRTYPVRSDVAFRNFIKEIQAKKFAQTKRFVTSARITRAILNQYKKYPGIAEDLYGADLK